MSTASNTVEVLNRNPAKCSCCGAPLRVSTWEDNAYRLTTLRVLHPARAFQDGPAPSPSAFLFDAESRLVRPRVIPEFGVETAWADYTQSSLVDEQYRISTLFDALITAVSDRCSTERYGPRTHVDEPVAVTKPKTQAECIAPVTLKDQPIRKLLL